MPSNSKGYESLLRKVYNRFPEMVTDESLVAAHWLIADKGKQHYQDFISELQKDPPNNLPDEDAVDWRTRITPVGGKETMLTWVPTSRPKEDIESLRANTTSASDVTMDVTSAQVSYTVAGMTLSLSNEEYDNHDYTNGNKMKETNLAMVIAF